MNKILMMVAALLCSQAAIAAKPVITLTVTPTAGAGAISPVATWSVTNAVSCTASGAWSGTKPLSGTETLPPQTANGEIRLTCVSDKGVAVLSWLPPTQNTDGSALTNLAGFRLYEGETSGVLYKTIALPNPSLTSHVREVDPGPHYWAMRAYNAAELESALTNEVTKVVQVESATKTVAFTVQSVPNAPSNITIK